MCAWFVHGLQLAAVECCDNNMARSFVQVLEEAHIMLSFVVGRMHRRAAPPASVRPSAIVRAGCNVHVQSQEADV